jgi:hypothetical protein
MRGLLAALLLLPASPAFALTVISEEAVAIEAACNGMQLGAEQCACIAGDAVTTLDARMRQVVLMSLEDDVGFTIRMQSGEFANEEVIALNDYQVYVQTKCAVGAYGE